MRSWYRKSIIFIVIVLITAACGGGTPPGGGAPTDAGGSAQSSAQAPADNPSGNSPAAPSGSTQSAAQAPAGKSPAAQPVKTAGGATQNAVKLSASNQPGASIKSAEADSIVVGRDIDEQKPAILNLDWTVPVDTPTIYFGFAAKNKEERTFIQKLFYDEKEYQLKDLAPLPVKPPDPGKKVFMARGLRVKSGSQFPEGRYRIEVYSESSGTLIQKTVWDVKRPAQATLNFGWLPLATALGSLWNSDRAYDPAPFDPDMFTVVEVPPEYIDEDFEYYTESELEQAYVDLNDVDQEFEPFPEEIQQEIEAQTDLDNESLCEQAGGTYDAFDDQCYVNEDPAQACLDFGGTYENDSCYFFPSDEIPLSEDIQQAIEAQADQDSASLCEQAGGTYDASTDLCYPNEEPASVSSNESPPTTADTTSDVAPPTAADTSESLPPAPVPTGNIAEGSDVTFSWDAVPDPTGVTYTIEVLDDADNVVTTLSDIGDTSVIVSLNEYGCSFSWAVMAIQNGVEGPWSDLISFNICQ